MTWNHLPIVSALFQNSGWVGKSWGALKVQTEKRGGTQPGNLILNRTSPRFVAHFTLRSPLGSAKDALRIGRLLYLPAAPTERDGACWEILSCFGIKATFWILASTLKIGTGRVMAAQLIWKEASMTQSLIVSTCYSLLLSFHQLFPTFWGAVGIETRKAEKEVCAKSKLDQFSKDPTNALHQPVFHSRKYL